MTGRTDTLGWLLDRLHPAWHAQAGCRSMDLGLFFPPKGASVNSFAFAREVCAACPVRLECLAECLDGPDYLRREGWRGGLPPRERTVERLTVDVQRLRVARSAAAYPGAA